MPSKAYLSHLLHGKGHSNDSLTPQLRTQSGRVTQSDLQSINFHNVESSYSKLFFESNNLAPVISGRV